MESERRKQRASQATGLRRNHEVPHIHQVQQAQDGQQPHQQRRDARKAQPIKIRDGNPVETLPAPQRSRRDQDRSRLWLLGGGGGALLVFCLIFSRTAYAWIPERTGLYMSIVGIGAAMLIAVAAQTGWRSPRFLSPLLLAGQRSYEIYLTHMFVVIALAGAFAAAGNAMWAVPLFFIGVLVIASLLGEAVARIYSEPMNRWLRGRWNDGAARMGSVLEEPAPATEAMLR
jgi:peptidoglycan/LPS O-acetylase OafA/YrhL